jgi:hypothetical protein
MSITDGPAVRGMFKQMVSDFGGVQAAAALLGCNIGTISKQANGDMKLCTEHYIKLEDALGVKTISKFLYNRDVGGESASDTNKLASSVLKEVGDIGPAILKWISEDDVDAFLKEGPEAISILELAIERARGQE